MRKPVDMKVRTYFQHLLHINLEELVNIPPYNPNQSLGDDEIMDIILYGTPKSWQCEMDRQGYDPLEHTIAEVVGFMEQVESAEDFDAADKKLPAKVTNKTKATMKPGETIPKKKFCLIHGHGNHSSD